MGMLENEDPEKPEYCDCGEYVLRGDGHDLLGGVIWCLQCQMEYKEEYLEEVGKYGSKS